MIILGIDPGTAATGYAVLKIEESPEVIDYGCIRTSNHKKMPERLRIIYQKVNRIVQKYHPQEVAIEQVFFSKNKKTILSVGEARGVIMLAASSKGGRLFNYTPLQVKKAVTGYGRARKEQVQCMVKKLLRLSQIPPSDDAVDAIAIALCHHYSRKLRSLENLAP